MIENIDFKLFFSVWISYINTHIQASLPLLVYATVQLPNLTKYSKTAFHFWP